MKNRESKLNMSAIVVSSLLLCVCWSSLTSFSFVTVRFQPEVESEWICQPKQSKETGTSAGPQQSRAYLV